MKKNIYKILTLSAMTALLATACSDSSTGSDDSNPAPHTSAISSNDTTDDLLSSSSENDYAKNESNIYSSSSSVEAESSCSEAVDSSSSEGTAAESSSSDEELSSSSSEGAAAESSSSDEELSSSSSEGAAAESSSSNEELSSSSSEEPVAESSSSEEPAPTLSTECLEMRSTKDKFIPAEDVFDCVLPKEKLVLVIRHGERWKDASGTTGDLNEHGKSQSSYLGKKLAEKSLEEFYYVSTKTYRTLNTNMYISKGKGESFLDSATVFSKDSSYHYLRSEDFTSDWYIKGNKGKCGEVGSWPRFTMFAYDPTACPDEFYDADEKTAEIINKHFKFEDLQHITVVSTHDNFIAPFLISITDRKIGLEAHEYVYPNNQYNDWNQNVFKHWPNYLAGVAIIVNENNERAFVPIKGLNTGYLGYHCDGTEEGYTCTKWEKDVQ